MRIEMYPIGYVDNQVLKQTDTNWGKEVSIIKLDEPFKDGLIGLEDFSHAVILYYLHEAKFIQEEHIKRRPQGRKDMPIVGLFSQRVKDRPNPIGMTAVEIIKVVDGCLYVKGLDAINQTPILDIKPYYPVYDKKDEAKTPEWVDELMKNYF